MVATFPTKIAKTKAVRPHSEQIPWRSKGTAPLHGQRDLSLLFGQRLFPQHHCHQPSAPRWSPAGVQWQQCADRPDKSGDNVRVASGGDWKQFVMLSIEMSYQRVSIWQPQTESRSDQGSIFGKQSPAASFKAVRPKQPTIVRSNSRLNFFPFLFFSSFFFFAYSFLWRDIAKWSFVPTFFPPVHLIFSF